MSPQGVAAAGRPQLLLRLCGIPQGKAVAAAPQGLLQGGQVDSLRLAGENDAEAVPCRALRQGLPDGFLGIVTRRDLQNLIFSGQDRDKFGAAGTFFRLHP